MKKLSIIIPTLNEEAHLEEAIRALLNRVSTDWPKEIIVADGGSADRTGAVARQLGVTFIECPDAPKGRAYLLNQGAEAATGDVLLFLDADSRVPQGYDGEILKRLKEPHVVGGAFEFALDGREFGLRLVEFINRTRYRIWKRYYGDQGIFVTSDVFYRAGRYPQIGLMEASEFCVALGRQGKLVLIKQPMLTSARRFLDHGIYRVLSFDIKMWWLNLIGQDVESFASSYWGSNDL